MYRATCSHSDVSMMTVEFHSNVNNVQTVLRAVVNLTTTVTITTPLKSLALSITLLNSLFGDKISSTNKTYLTIKLPH